MREPAVALVAGDDAAVERRAAGLRSAGWRVQRGWALPEEPWDQSGRRVACHGVVEAEADVSAAVLAGARGAVVLAVARAPEPLVARLVADLARLGPVDHVDAHPGVDAGDGALTAAAGLDEDQRALLALLAEGATTVEAARARHLSTRSAERRLAAARVALGVRTTAEALARLRSPAGPPRPEAEVAP